MGITIVNPWQAVGPFEGPAAMVRPISLFFPNIGDPLLVVAYLATVSQSGGNAEFGEDDCLKQDPPRNNQQDNPDAHAALSFLRLVWFRWFQHVPSTVSIRGSSRPPRG